MMNSELKLSMARQYERNYNNIVNVQTEVEICDLFSSIYKIKVKWRIEFVH